MLQRNEGHVACAAYIQGYLERDEDGRWRPLARAFLNLRGPDEQRSWAYFMDRTRRLAGNDVSTNGREPVTYRHYVIAPDPEDGASTEELMSLVREWAEEFFGTDAGRGRLGSYEVAAVAHDDNENGVAHAHVIVNNTDLETGARMHVSNSENAALWDRLQEMSAARGLSSFGPEAEHRSAVAERRRSERREAARGRYVTRTERALRKEGRYVWKDALAAMVQIARRTSHDEAGFAGALEGLGVGVRRRREYALEAEGPEATAAASAFLDRVAGMPGVKVAVRADGGRQAGVMAAVRESSDPASASPVRAAALEAGVPLELVDDDFVYSHPSNPERWTISGRRLGRSYAREGVADALASDASRRAARGEAVRENVRAYVLSAFLESLEGAASVEAGTTLSQVAAVLEVNDEHGVRCLGDYARVAADLGRRAELMKAAGVGEEAVAAVLSKRARVAAAREIAARAGFFDGVEDPGPARRGPEPAPRPRAGDGGGRAGRAAPGRAGGRGRDRAAPRRSGRAGRNR